MMLDKRARLPISIIVVMSQSSDCDVTTRGDVITIHHRLGPKMLGWAFVPTSRDTPVFSFVWTGPALAPFKRWTILCRSREETRVQSHLHRKGSLGSKITEYLKKGSQGRLHSSFCNYKSPFFLRLPHTLGCSCLHQGGLCLVLQLNSSCVAD